LRGERKGQFSFRLSRAYRDFYRIEKDTDGRDVIAFILVLEVNKQISRQHLHQIENGAKGVSPERAVQFARTLKHRELLFVKLALQDLVDEAGLKATVELKTAS